MLAVMCGLNIAKLVLAVWMCFKSPAHGFSFAASGLAYYWDSLYVTLSVEYLVCLSTSVTNKPTGSLCHYKQGIDAFSPPLSPPECSVYKHNASEDALL